jgi:hypothetical protein
MKVDKTEGTLKRKHTVEMTQDSDYHESLKSYNSDIIEEECTPNIAEPVYEHLEEVRRKRIAKCGEKFAIPLQYA